jgi:signal transduction histidine kinase/CheY-like chemotaxis protein/HPt (histidine-containing phosphotransfer) domain-containing protein
MSAMLQEFLQQQGYAVCEYLGDGEFRLLAEPPEWFAQIWGAADAKKKSLRLGDDSPFLEGFLMEAEAFWESPRETGVAGVLSSGAWMEQSRAELGAIHEIPLEALALRMDGKRVLSLVSQPEAFAERTRVLQTARDGLLVHERLRKEVQKKEILLHCIIHDLSQPLTAMRGCFEVLALEGVSARTKKFLEIGKQQAEQQDEMIREVLKAFSADLQEGLEPGGRAAEQPDLLRCAQETVTAFAPVFEAKGIRLQLEPRIESRGGAGESSQAAGERDWKVVGEYSRLKRIFSNLVENALRYAPSGSVVTIGIEHDGGYLKAFVQDQGPGLPKDFKAAEAFKLFAKGKEGGGKAGLGLYFCRITVERWGGTIGCEPMAPRGTRFWFRLPAGRTEENAKTSGEGLKQPEPIGVQYVVATGSTEAATRAERMERVAGEPPPQMHRTALEVLLADDDAAIREVTVLLLKHQGHKVVAVDNGQDALRMLESRRFDIVLLDGEMPRMSGAETARRIRATEKGSTKHQIILSLSGNNTEADQRRFREAGVDACLSKPFRAEALNQALAQFAFPGKPQAGGPLSATSKADTSRAAGGGQAEPATIGEGYAELLARMGGNAKLLQRVSGIFLQDYPKKLSLLRKALARKNAAAVGATAHLLKGAVSNFGAPRARQLAEDLQNMGRGGELSGAAKCLAELEEEFANLEKKLRGYRTEASRTGSPSGKGKAGVRRRQKRGKR